MTDVRHDPSDHRFTTVVDDTEGYVEYELDGDVMTLTHTIVPDAIGGRGVASGLTRAAFDYARAHDLKIRPACSYAAAWVERHPEVNQLIV